MPLKKRVEKSKKEYATYIFFKRAAFSKNSAFQKNKTDFNKKMAKKSERKLVISVTYEKMLTLRDAEILL